MSRQAPGRKFERATPLFLVAFQVDPVGLVVSNSTLHLQVLEVRMIEDRRLDGMPIAEAVVHRPCEPRNESIHVANGIEELGSRSMLPVASFVLD